MAALPNSPLVSVEDYQNTSYDPDVEFVEYANKGVQNIWLIDPRLQLIWMYRPPALVEIQGETISTADLSVELSRSEIFAD